MSELSPAVELRWKRSSTSEGHFYSDVLQQRITIMSGYEDDSMGIPQPVYIQEWRDIPVVKE